MSIKGRFIMTMEPAISSATPFSRSNHRRPKTHLALTLSLGILSLLTAHAGQPTNAEESHAWPAYGGGPENTHYSTLAQINRENVSTAGGRTFDTGDSYPGSEMECNPIIVGGVLYATSPKNNVVALDAATGKLRWRFDPNAGRKVVGKMRNRGVAYWGDRATDNDRRISLQPVNISTLSMRNRQGHRYFRKRRPDRSAR